MVIDSQVRNGVKRVVATLRHQKIVARGQQLGRTTTRHRRRDDAMGKTDELAARIEAARHAVRARRTVEVGAHVVFATPHELDRHRGQAARDGHSLGDVITLSATTEGTADLQAVHPDSLARQPGDFHRRILCPRGCLRTHPDFAETIMKPDRGGNRFERSVGKKRRVIIGDEPAVFGIATQTIDVATYSSRLTLIGHPPRQLPLVLRGVLRLVGPRIPIDLERGSPALRRPERIGDHGDAHRQHPYRHHAGNGERCGIVDAAQDTVERRRALEHRHFHPGQFEVDAEYGAAIDLRRRVETRRTRTEQPELHGIFERRLGRHRERPRDFEQLRKWRSPRIVRRIEHAAILHPQPRRVDLPLARCGGDQKFARRGTERPKRQIARANTARVTRRLITALVTKFIGRGCQLCSDPGHRQAKLLGDQHRQSGQYTLPHLGLVHRDEDRTIGLHREPRRAAPSGRRRRHRRLLALPRPRHRQVQGQPSAARRACCANHELTTIGATLPLHGLHSTCCHARTKLPLNSLSAWLWPPTPPHFGCWSRC